jgi:hypothetical protein
MPKPKPDPISRARRRVRIERALRIARRLGFVGEIEYRHVYGRSGGAQYRAGSSPEDDTLVVYAKAFERDADPNDFSLEAIIAHERGHQLVKWDHNIRATIRRLFSDNLEEFFGSLLGYLLLGETEASWPLRMKASTELLRAQLPADDVDAFVDEVISILRRHL